MFRYRLRTLLMVLVLLPPMLAAAFFLWQWAIAPPTDTLVRESRIEYLDGTRIDLERQPPADKPATPNRP